MEFRISELSAEQKEQLERQFQVEKIVRRIEELKSLLASWDYKTSKRTDGDYTEQEWQEIVAQRRKWRAEINELESQLDGQEIGVSAEQCQEPKVCPEKKSWFN